MERRLQSKERNNSKQNILKELKDSVTAAPDQVDIGFEAPKVPKAKKRKLEETIVNEFDAMIKELKEPNKGKAKKRRKRTNNIKDKKNLTRLTQASS